MDMRSLWLRLCLFAAATCLPILSGSQTACAQVEIPQSALREQNEISELLAKGQELENAGRWREAYQFYLQEGRAYSSHIEIKNRKAMARIRYDLNRRYSDSSYVKNASSSDYAEAQNVLHEIFLKIDTWHVDRPDWYLMLRHGVSSIEVALLQHDEFKKRYVASYSAENVRTAISNIHGLIKDRNITDRQQAFRTANSISQSLFRDLKIPQSATLYEFACGAIVSLDAYSSYLTPAQYGETMSQIEGNFVGLGVELKTSNEHLEIVDVIANGPAGRAGIQTGDRIIAVADKSVKELGGNTAADLLRGEAGSQVAVTVLKTNQDNRRLVITRAHIEIPSVQSVKIVDPRNGVGYVRLTNFQKNTVRDLDTALWQLHRQGMKKLIVDVRGNPGGLLNTAVEVSNRFLQHGKIVSTRGRNPLEEFDHRAQYNGTWRIPLVVLVDENSASASEIFAAAIQDRNRGTIVGSKSYGKGSVQGIFKLNSARGGVRLTTAKFYGPSGRAISDHGVTPSVSVHNTAKQPLDQDNRTADKNDRVLSAAIQVANGNHQQRAVRAN